MRRRDVQRVVLVGGKVLRQWNVHQHVCVEVGEIAGGADSSSSGSSSSNSSSSSSSSSSDNNSSGNISCSLSSSGSKSYPTNISNKPLI